jgi:hypothetical protein
MQHPTRSDDRVKLRDEVCLELWEMLDLFNAS